MLKFRGGMQAPEKDVPEGKAALGGFSTQSRVSLIGAVHAERSTRTGQRPYRGVLLSGCLGARNTVMRVLGRDSGAEKASVAGRITSMVLDDRDCVIRRVA